MFWVFIVFLFGILKVTMSATARHRRHHGTIHASQNSPTALKNPSSITVSTTPVESVASKVERIIDNTEPAIAPASNETTGITNKLSFVLLAALGGTSYYFLDPNGKITTDVVEKAYEKISGSQS